jgi:hypothetical protein
MDVVEVIRMSREGRAGRSTESAGGPKAAPHHRFRRWLRSAALFAASIGLFGWTAAAGGAPRQPPRGPSQAFDLAVAELDVRQVSSTPMFREVEVRCVVTNRGPHNSRGAVTIVVSRPGDDGPKVLKKIGLPDTLAPGDTFVTRAEGSAWFASQVPYRCEIQYGEPGGDADPSDDFRELTYPKL